MASLVALGVRARVAAHPHSWWEAGTYTTHRLTVPLAPHRTTDKQPEPTPPPPPGASPPPSVAAFSVMCEEGAEEELLPTVARDLAEVALRFPPRALLRIAESIHVWCNTERAALRGSVMHWVSKEPVFEALGYHDSSAGASGSTSTSSQGEAEGAATAGAASRAATHGGEPHAPGPPTLTARPLGVEIHNFHDFCSYALHNADNLLHEMSHVYHALVGEHDADIEALFQHAVTSRRYDAVLVNHPGHTEVPCRAYALNNNQECFASLSVAFLGGSNDYEPFTRAQLEVMDPESVPILRRLWARMGDPER